MTTAPDLSIIIPAYDEASRLERTVREIDAYLAETGRRCEVIVVDDGSRDGTSALALRLEGEMPYLRLIRLPENRGKGYAVRTGVVNASGSRVLFADADGATPIGELERLERALDRGADVAIGSRALGGDDTRVRSKLYRRVMGRLFHLLVTTLTVRGIRDTQCGFKLFTGQAADSLFSRMRMDGFSFDVELLLLARRSGYTIAEVPVNWEHQPGSRINLLVDSLKMARDLFVIRNHLVRGRYRERQVPPAVLRPPAGAAGHRNEPSGH